LRLFNDDCPLIDHNVLRAQEAKDAEDAKVEVANDQENDAVPENEDSD
jgi:hypothetical protein